MDINNILDAACVPAIMTAVYITIEVLKKAIRHDGFSNLIPLLCVMIGAAFGGVLFVAVPSMIPADNLLMAVLMGGVSGWAATGADQTLKRLSGGDKDDG